MKRRLDPFAVLVLLAFAASPALAKHKPKDTWHPAVSSASAPCDQINERVKREIAQYRALKTTIQKEEAAPPRSLEGIWERLEGKTGADEESLRKLAETRRTIDDLNTMLKSSECKPVDVASELAKP